MAVKLVQGEQKDITYRLSDENGDPLDLSLYETVYACFKDAVDVHKKRLLRSSTVDGTTAVITGIDSRYCDVGDLVAGTGIPVGAKILTVDSLTQITLDQNTTIAGSPTLTIGDGVIVSGVTQIGKFKVTLKGADTLTMTPGSINSEVDLEKSLVPSRPLFPATLNVVAKIC